MGIKLDLHARRHVILDGAMGTELQKRGHRLDPALHNLSSPDSIIEIHRDYLKAGADILTANTFGAYTHKHDNAEEIIKAAISHGRAAINNQPDKWLALDMGPTGLMLEPYGDTTHEECFDIFNTAVETGAKYGADLIIIETMMDLTELELAIKAAKQTNLPVLATMSFDKNGVTMMGVSINDMVQSLEKLGVDAIGMNCGFGPDLYAKLVAELSSKTSLPIIVQPNAGLPVTSPIAGEGTSYNLTPEDFADAMAAMDAKFLGGCCGTSPAHIEALVKKLNE